jgi:hypothetical protein
MAGQNIRQFYPTVLAGLACGVIGWLLGHSAPDLSKPAAVAAQSSAPAPHTLLDPGPVIVVGSDGRVTLHVDHESLKWVLAEIDRQAGSAAGAAISATRDAASAPEAREPAPAAAAVAHPEEVVARVMRGTEPERYESLAQAQGGGLVSEDMLKTLYQSDASPRVRLLAFEYAQEGTEADPQARRSELEAARLLPDPVVSQEAARRLDALDLARQSAAPQATSQN